MGIGVNPLFSRDRRDEARRRYLWLVVRTTPSGQSQTRRTRVYPEQRAGVPLDRKIERGRWLSRRVNVDPSVGDRTNHADGLACRTGSWLDLLILIPVLNVLERRCRRRIGRPGCMDGLADDTAFRMVGRPGRGRGLSMVEPGGCGDLSFLPRGIGSIYGSPHARRGGWLEYQAREST